MAAKNSPAKKAASKKAATKKAAAKKAAAPAAIVEYAPGAAFPGVIGRTFDVSTPAWPEPVRPAADTPNVLFIVIDDTGFGHLGCYGSPINTPNFDRLAANGLRYTNMHTEPTARPRARYSWGRSPVTSGVLSTTPGGMRWPRAITIAPASEPARVSPHASRASGPASTRLWGTTRR
jgi:hypothetical protein